MKKSAYLLLVIIPLLVQSCGPAQRLTRGDAYPAMYSDSPLAIAVMPPINKTTNVDAKEYFYFTMSRTLCERGYYVISPFLAMELFKTESAYDAENYATASLNQFREVLGADAALFTYITDWKKSALTSSITVSVEYVLRSAKTNETIFQRKGIITYDAAVATNAGLLGAVANLAATALSDFVPVARACNEAVLSDLPAGKYSASFDVDKTVVAGPKEVRKTVK